MSAPSGACSSVPKKIAKASQRSRRREARERSRRCKVASVSEDREEREDAVPELDVRVEALRLEVVRLAAGPVLAAEAGAGQAHRRAGGDDQDEHHRVRRARAGGTQLSESDARRDARERLGSCFHALTVAPLRRPASTVPTRARKSACARELGLERRPLVAGQRDEQAAGRLRVVGELDELRRDIAGRRPARTRGCCACPRSRRPRAPPRAHRRAPAAAPPRARSGRRCASPSRAHARAARSPVTSVTAFGANEPQQRRPRRGSACASSARPRPASARPRFAPPSTSAVPSGFVR